MHNSEYDSVVWDTSTPDNQEGSSSNTGRQADTGSAKKADRRDRDEPSPSANTSSAHTSPFGRIGDDGIDDISGSHFGAGGAGAPFNVAYGGDTVNSSTG
ncbi:hypothetical protein GGI23_006073, partial [Coemansia sp. RSA 2559]